MESTEAIERGGVVSVIRLDDLSGAVAIAEALIDGGVRAIEFTFTNPSAARAIEAAAAKCGRRALVGAGSVLDAETARVAILAGASFIVTPTLRRQTIELCRRYSVPVVVGGFTPTELLAAWEAGASYVKVFPARVGGPEYIKDLLGPLPQLKVIPTGGVTPENAGQFIQAGAVAVALGSNLVDAQTVERGDWSVLAKRARQAIDAVAEARRTRARPT